MLDIDPLLNAEDLCVKRVFPAQVSDACETCSKLGT